MMTQIRQWFIPTVFEGDKDRFRMGILINIILGVFLISSLGYWRLVPVATEFRMVRVAIIVTVLLVVLVLKQLLNQSLRKIDEAFAKAKRELNALKQTEEELRESEERYRAVIENQTEFIVRWKPDGTRTFVNEAYCRYFGIVAEAAISTSFMPLIIDEDRRAMEARISRLLSGAAAAESYVHRVKRPDGSLGWQEWTDQVIRDETGQVVEFQSVGRDISDRKQVETALREAEQNYRAIFENANEGILRIASNGETLMTNPAAARILGYDSPEEVISAVPNIVAIYVDPARRAEFRSELETHGEARDFEVQLYHKSGNRIWVSLSAHAVRDSNGTVLSHEGFARDITERKQAEFRLQQYANRMEILHEIDRSLLSARSAHEIAKGALGRIRHLIPCLRASVSLFDFEKEQAAFLAADFDGSQTIPETPISFEEYGLNVIDELRQDKPWSTDSMLHESENKTELEKRLANEYGIHAWLSLPLLSQGQLIGALNLGRGLGESFSVEEAEFAREVADQIAIVIQQNRLFEATQRQIREQKLAEEKLSQSEERYRLISSLSSEYVFSNTFHRDGNITYDWQSGAFESISGYSLDELRQMGLRAILHPEDVATNNDFLEKLKLNQKVSGELRLITKSGEIRWLREYLHPVWNEHENHLVGIYGAVQDITERKKAEESLRKAEAKYRTLIEQIPPIVFIAARDQHIGVTYISPRITSLGFTQEEWVADPELWLRQIHPDDQARVLEEIEQIKRSGEPFRSEYRLRTRDKVVRWFLEESMDVIDSAGNFLFRQGFMLDITERKQAEEELQLLNIELEHRVVERTAQLNEANQNLHYEKARLEQYSRQRELMATMTDLLQASLSTDEASGIVSSHLQLLFPNRDGALYLLNTSGILEPIAIWGEQRSMDTIFSVNDCWALRRGKTYRFGNGLPNPSCAHVGKEIPQNALCIPLTAQGESLGSLYISTESVGENGLIDDEEQRFIETITDSVALALANLRLRERLRNQTIRDPLTGIFNRRFMEETLEREVHRAGRNYQSLCVIMFEIDDFKQYNNTFGHDAGDYVLKKVTDTMTSRLRRSDFPCRYGGDEFTLILPDTTLEDGANRAEELRKAVEALALSFNNQALGAVTVRMGVAVYPKHGETGEAVLKVADDASYRARAIGKNCVVIAD